MKLNTRLTAAIGAAILLAIAGITHYSDQQTTMARDAANESRGATLQGFRVAHSLKSLANGYELAMNEYYSTVLDFPTYRKKAADHQAAIQRELATLTGLRTGAPESADALNQAFKEMETYRMALEAALAPSDKDWDAAREALFKLNVVSVRAIQQADTLATVAGERATALDADLQASQGVQQNLALVNKALAFAGLALMLLCALRSPRPAP